MQSCPANHRLTLCIVVAFAANGAHAQLPLPAGLEPGERYHLVFNSSTFTNGTSANVEVYDQLVQMAADGALSSSLAWDEFGQSNGVDAWTGSNTDGTAAQGLTLGNGGLSAWCGRPTFTGTKWINFLAPPTLTPLHVYGLSEELTVVAGIAGDFNIDKVVNDLDIDPDAKCCGHWHPRLPPVRSGWAG